MRPAPDPRGPPRPLRPLGSALPSLPLPSPACACLGDGLCACVSPHPRRTVPFCSALTSTLHCPGRGCGSVCRHSPEQGGAQGARARGGSSVTLRRLWSLPPSPSLSLSPLKISLPAKSALLREGWGKGRVRRGVRGVFFLFACPPPPKCGRIGSAGLPHPCIRDWLREKVDGAATAAASPREPRGRIVPGAATLRPLPPLPPARPEGLRGESCSACPDGPTNLPAAAVGVCLLVGGSRGAGPRGSSGGALEFSPGLWLRPHLENCRASSRQAGRARPTGMHEL